MKYVVVKPAPGYVVRGRNNAILPEEGARVRLDSFWSRRIAEGACVRVEEKKPATKSKPKKVEEKTNDD